MRPTFVVSLTLALASTAVATFSEACPPLGTLTYEPIFNKCVCLVGLKKSDPKPECKVVIKKDLLGILKWCEATCPAPPHPSHKPKPKRNQPILMPDGTISRCPSAMTACPLEAPPSLNGERATATVSMNDPYECVKPEEDLYNCGGCTMLGKGTNCNAITGVRGTSCNDGKCMIYTCQKGYTLTVNEDGDQECVRKTPRRV
ncbi:choline transport protein [Ceratobasidium sp. AG-Ba]|nr:choline transport protein [Ceratobasidium sp. AG-Ba]